jgi:hypothetical protein
MANGHLIPRRFLAATGLAATGSLGLLMGDRTDAAGVPGLKCGPLRRVGAEGAKYFEPWIASNPGDGSNLVVVRSRYLGEVATRWSEHMGPVVWFTADGGGTWSAGELEGTDQMRRGTAGFADSYATYAPDGTAFCVFAGSLEGDHIDLCDPKLSARPYGTDYIALAAPPEGSFHAVWVDTQNGKREFQTVRFEAPA